MKNVATLFHLTGKVAVITGGAGLLGFHHAAAVLEAGGTPILLDIDPKGLDRAKDKLKTLYGQTVHALECNITDVSSVVNAMDAVLGCFSHIDILINNAARNPKVESSEGVNFSRLENFPNDQWDLDLAVGLGGAFNCSKIFGTHMSKTGNGGVIVNIASDLGVIAPDQRLYRTENLEEHLQPVKPVTYSVVKHGLIGLTKYLSTYWCDKGVRCNCLSPGGVYANQDDVFIGKIQKLIPMGRMAQVDEYKGAIAFLCSEASSYMNGANLVIDGGRSVW